MPSKKEIWKWFKNLKPKEKVINFLIGIYRQFGFLGVATILGGFYMLYLFPKQKEFKQQILYAIVGLILLIIAFLKSHHRNMLLVDMAKNTCNRLSEAIGKGKMSKESIEFIGQKIRKIHSDTGQATSDLQADK